MKKMKYTIIKERCTGCRFCERSCPGATQLNADGKAEIINENLLQQCGGERLCPFGAIENTQKDQDQELNPLKSGNYTVSRSNATTFQPNARTNSPSGGQYQNNPSPSGQNVPQNINQNTPPLRTNQNTPQRPNQIVRGRNVPQNLSNNMPQGKGRGQGGMGRGMGRGQGGMGRGMGRGQGGMGRGMGRGQGGMGRGMGRGQGGMGQNPINRRSNNIAGRDPHISRQGKNRNGNRKKNNNTKRG